MNLIKTVKPNLEKFKTIPKEHESRYKSTERNHV